MVAEQVNGTHCPRCGERRCCCQGDKGEVVGLCCMKPGQCGIIRRTCATGADAAYLRALGLRCNQRIRLCRARGAWIVEVGCHGGPASRIGLAKSLAEQVHVEVPPDRTQPRAV